jgi:hypothetical protein
MKVKIAFLCLMMAGTALNGQEVQLNSAVLTNAGSSNGQTDVNLSE